MTRVILAVAVIPAMGCMTPLAAQGSVIAPQSMRIANLQRAAQYPWLDDGACVVREASHDWNVLVETCYGALDLERMRFNDRDGSCPIASVDAATMGRMVAVCLLVQPQLIVGAVIVVRIVIVAAKIAEELERSRCPPCTGSLPPPRVDSDHSHYPCPGEHVHYWVWEQNPTTCQCFIKDRLACL